MKKIYNKMPRWAKWLCVGIIIIVLAIPSYLYYYEMYVRTSENDPCTVNKFGDCVKEMSPREMRDYERNLPLVE